MAVLPSAVRSPLLSSRPLLWAVFCCCHSERAGTQDVPRPGRKHGFVCPGVVAASLLVLEFRACHRAFPGVMANGRLRICRDRWFRVPLGSVAAEIAELTQRAIGRAVTDPSTITSMSPRSVAQVLHTAMS